MAERLKLKRRSTDPVEAMKPHPRSFSCTGFSVLHDFEDEACCFAFHSETQGTLHVVLSMATVAELTELLQDHLDAFAGWQRRRGRHAIELKDRRDKPRSPSIV